MPQAYSPANLTAGTGNTHTDMKMQYKGFKYPDRTYGHKHNPGYSHENNKKGHHTSSALQPPRVHKPIAFPNMQSLSYY